MLPLTDLALGLTRFAVIQPDPAIRTHANQGRPVGTEPHAVDIVSMFILDAGIEFKRRPVVENEVLIIARGGGAERSLLSDGDGVDLLGMTIDFADGISTVPGNAMTITLFPVANSNDTLGIAVPGQIVNAAVDNAVFSLGDTVANTIPDPD